MTAPLVIDADAATALHGWRCTAASTTGLRCTEPVFRDQPWLPDAADRLVIHDPVLAAQYRARRCATHAAQREVHR